MQLGGPAAEEFGSLKRWAGMFQNIVAKLVIAKEAGGWGRGWRWKGCNRGEECRELLEEPLPSISLIDNQALQHRKGGFLCSRRSHDNFAEEWGDAREA